MGPASPLLSIGPLALSAQGELLLVEREGVTWALPLAALAALAARYGRPAGDDVAEPASWLELPAGARLAALSHRAPVDVIANDFAAWRRGPAAPWLLVPAPLFVAALQALGRATSPPG